MSTPDASQYTRFKRYASVSGDAIGSVGSKINPFNTSYTLPVLTASSQALFLPSANKQEKFGTLPVYTGPLTLNSTVTNPVPITGGYNLFTFTPTESGWYRIIVDQFGGANDMDLAVGYGNTELDIPAVLDYDLNSNDYDTPPETPIKVFSFSGGVNDRVASYFSSGCTYQVLVIGYEGNYGGTYTLTVRDNSLSVGVTLVSMFYYTGSWQLYRFVAPSTHLYLFELNFDSYGNDADLFISKPNTTLDIQGCIDWDNEEAPGDLPASVLAYGNEVGPDSVNASLISGATYEVLVYEYFTDDLFRQYELSVSLN